MTITGTDSTLMKAFIKSCKKITANFNEESLTKLLPVLELYLLDDKKQLDINKFEPNNKYYDMLFAFHVIHSMKKSNKIFNTFMLHSNKKPKNKKIQVPENWKIINGGKK